MNPRPFVESSGLTPARLRRFHGDFHITCCRTRSATRLPRVSGRSHDVRPSPGSYPLYSRASTQPCTSAKVSTTDFITVDERWQLSRTEPGRLVVSKTA